MKNFLLARTHSTAAYWACAIALIVFGLLLNIVPAKIALYFELPVFLDSIGTILVAMLGGTLPAVIVGFFSNAFNGLSDITTLYYGIISILIGVAATLFQQRKFFVSVPKIIVSILVFTLLGGGLGSILTYFLYGYNFGEGISAPFATAIYENLGWTKFFSQLTADIIIDILDKTIVVATAVISYRFIDEHYKRLFSKTFLFEPYINPQHKLFKRSLLRKVVFIVIVAEILLGALASVTGFILYKQVSIGKFTDIAHGLTEAATVVIDAERVDEFIAQGREAPGYRDIEQQLYKIREGFPQAQYLYVYKILEDGCHVVFDLISKDGEPGSDPGDVVAFDPSFKPYLPNLFKGEPIEPIISDDQYGWLLTVYRPLKNSAGKTVAYVAADISMGEIVYDQA